MIFPFQLTITGIFIVFYEQFISNADNRLVLKGDTLLVLAVLSFSLYISLGKAFIDKYGALKVTTFAFMAGSMLDIPVFIFDMRNLNTAKLSPMGIFSFLYLAIVISFIAYFTWYYILKTIKISMLTTVSNLSPVLTVLFSVILLHEKISLYFIIGGVITVMGVMVMHKINVELA